MFKVKSTKCTFPTPAMVVLCISPTAKLRNETFLKRFETSLCPLFLRNETLHDTLRNVTIRHIRFRFQYVTFETFRNVTCYASKRYMVRYETVQYVTCYVSGFNTLHLKRFETFLWPLFLRIETLHTSHLCYYSLQLYLLYLLILLYHGLVHMHILICYIGY